MKAGIPLLSLPRALCTPLLSLSDNYTVGLSSLEEDYSISKRVHSGGMLCIVSQLHQVMNWDLLISGLLIRD